MNAIESILEEKGYYHGSLSRQDAESLLKGRVDGTFLLRKSLRAENSYVISVTFKGECLHYSMNPILLDGKIQFSINNGTRFSTPWEVCDHYMSLKGGLKVRLCFPIKKLNTVDYPYEMEVEWFHNEITREEDSRRLSQAYRKYRGDGIFLVRKKDETKYVLSVVKEEKVHRYIIQWDMNSGKYCMSGKQMEFKSLEELITFHKENPRRITGIQCQLTIPCPKNFCEEKKVNIPTLPNNRKPSKPHSSLVLSYELKKILPEGGLDMQWEPDRIPQSSEATPKNQPSVLKTSESRKWLDVFTKTSKKMPEECPGYNSIYQNVSNAGVAKDLFISEGDISIYEQLGKGHFGAVCLGRCHIVGERTPCAIKLLTGEDVMANKNELLAEASVMQTLDHPNIMRLIAVCETDQHLMMLLELAPLGSLRDFLKAKDESTFPESKIMNVMEQVCCGMEYLANNNIVHRDLAARNILLVSENFAKVSDFGMSKVLRGSENYYRSAQPRCWPLRWYSPEALVYYKFTTKCDVWSYGITLWEAFSYGNRPYKGMKGNEVLMMLEAGERLECPFSCPPYVYDLMLYCWTFEEESRPSFSQLLPLVNEISQIISSKQEARKS